MSFASSASSEDLGAAARDIEDALERTDLAALTLTQRRCVAGAFAQALARLENPATHDWAALFFGDLCRNRLGLSEDVALGLEPLLLERRSPADDAWGGAASPFLEGISPDRHVRWGILLSLLVTYLSAGKYDARTRAAFRHAARGWGVSWRRLSRREDALFESIRAGLLGQQLNSGDGSRLAARAGAKQSSAGRWAKIGLAAVGGAVLLGVTGGLAAPALLAGLGVVGAAAGMGTAVTTLAAFFSTTGGALLLLGVFGASGGGLATYRMARRTQGLDTFRFISLLDRGAAPPPPGGGGGQGGAGSGGAPAAPASSKRPPWVLLGWGGARPRSAAAAVPPLPSPAAVDAAPPSPAPVAPSPAEGGGDSSSDAAVLAEARRAAAARQGGTGVQVFIVSSGLLQDREQPEADFIEPWGGLANADVAARQRQAQEEGQQTQAQPEPGLEGADGVMGGQPAAAVTEGAIGSDIDRLDPALLPGAAVVASAVATPVSASAIATPAAGSALAELASRGIIAGSRVLLRPATLADRAAVYHFACRSEGALPFQEFDEAGGGGALVSAAAAPVRAAAAPLRGFATASATSADGAEGTDEDSAALLSAPLLPQPPFDVPLAAFGREWPDEWFRGPQADESPPVGEAPPTSPPQLGGQVYLILAPVRASAERAAALRRPTAAAATAPPQLEAYRTIGFVMHSALSPALRDTDDPDAGDDLPSAAAGAAAATYECELRLVIGRRRHWNRGLGSDALAALMRHLAAAPPPPSLPALAPPAGTPRGSSSSGGLVSRFLLLVPAPLERPLAVVCASKCGFNVTRGDAAGGGAPRRRRQRPSTDATAAPRQPLRWVRMAATPASLAAVLRRRSLGEEPEGGAEGALAALPSWPPPLPLVSRHEAEVSDSEGEGEDAGEGGAAPRPAAASSASASNVRLLPMLPSLRLPLLHLPALRPQLEDASAVVQPLVRGEGRGKAQRSGTLTRPCPPQVAGARTALRVGASLGTFTAGELASRPGWLRRLVPYGDLYALEWEPAVLRALGDSVSRFFRDWLQSQAVSQALGYTVLATVRWAMGGRANPP